MAITDVPEAGPAADDEPRDLQIRLTRTDQAYRSISTGAGLLTFALIGLILVFLVTEALPAIRQAGWSFLTTETWSPTEDPATSVFGVAATLYGTVVVALVALFFAVPTAVGCALYITEYVHPRVRGVLVAAIDLLAAVPSIIYGIWGREIFAEPAATTSRWMADHLGFIPIFRGNDLGAYTGSLWIAGLVVALMIVPITTSVVREVFAQVPPGEKEAALALGGTKWGMIRNVVLPFGRGGIIGGSMLGLGRALGETIAVALILSPAFEIRLDIISQGGNTVAALIATQYPESTPFGIQALIAAGLALFILTLVVNMIANVVIANSRSGEGVEI